MKRRGLRMKRSATKNIDGLKVKQVPAILTNSTNKPAVTKSKNYNMFAGDKEYKTNYFLSFLSSITFNRFQRDKFQRNFKPGRVFCLIFALLFLFLGGYAAWEVGEGHSQGAIYTYIYIIVGVIGSLGCLLAWKFIRLKYSNMRVRIILLVVMLLYQYIIWNFFSQFLCLGLFVLPAFLANLLFVYEWWKSLIYILLEIVSIQMFSYLQIIIMLDCYHLFYLLLISFLVTVLFSFFERAIKEDWVLYESFKKSEKIFSQALSTNPAIIFIVDGNGKVLYKNKAGTEINLSPTITHKRGSITCSKAPFSISTRHLSAPNMCLSQKFKHITTHMYSGGENIMDLVLPSQKEYVIDLLKAAMKNKQGKFILMIKLDKQLNLGELTHNTDFGLDKELVKNGYSMFEVEIDRIYWKSANALMLTLHNKMEELIFLHFMVMQILQIYSYSNFTQNLKTITEIECEEENENSEEINNALIIPTETRGFSYKEISQLMEYQNLIAAQLLIGNLKIEEMGFNLREMLMFVCESMALKFIEHNAELTLMISFDLPSEVMAMSSAVHNLLANILLLIGERSRGTEIMLKSKMIGISANKLYEIQFDFLFNQNEKLDYNELEEIFSIEAFTSAVLLENQTKIIKYGFGVFLINSFIKLMNGKFGRKLDNQIITWQIMLPFGQRNREVSIFSFPTLPNILIGDQESKIKIKFNKQTLQTNIDQDSKKTRKSIETKENDLRKTLRKEIEKEFKLKYDQKIKEKLEEEKERLENKYKSKFEKIKEKIRLKDSKISLEENIISPSLKRSNSGIDLIGISQQAYQVNNLKTPTTPTLASIRIKSPSPGRVTSVKTDLFSFEALVKRKMMEKYELHTPNESPVIIPANPSPIIDFAENARNRILGKIMGEGQASPFKSAVVPSSQEELGMQPARSRSELTMEEKEEEKEKARSPNRGEGPKIVVQKDSSPHIPQEFDERRKISDEIILNNKIDGSNIDKELENMNNEDIGLNNDSLFENIMERSPKNEENMIQHESSQDDIVLKRSTAYFEELDNLAEEFENELNNRDYICLSPGTPNKGLGYIRGNIFLASKKRLTKNCSNEENKIQRKATSQDKYNNKKVGSPMKGSFLIRQTERLLKNIKKSSGQPEEMPHKAPMIFIEQKSPDLSVTGGGFEELTQNSFVALKHNLAFKFTGIEKCNSLPKREMSPPKAPNLHPLRKPMANEMAKMRESHLDMIVKMPQPDIEKSPDIFAQKRNTMSSFSGTNFQQSKIYHPYSIYIVPLLQKSNSKELIKEKTDGASKEATMIKLPLSPIITDRTRIIKEINLQLIYRKQSECSNRYQRIIRESDRIIQRWEQNTTAPASTKLISRVLKVPKVLLVEDNNFSLNCLIGFVKRIKFDFDVAQNGVQAVDKFKNSAENESLFYTIIFMDLMMPLMDGFEATQTIRKIEIEKQYNPTFICGLSAHADLKTEEKCRKCGMDNYVSKPINISVMEKIILEQFEKNKT